MFELMQKKDYDFVKSLLPRLTLKQFHSLVDGKQGFIILKEKKTAYWSFNFYYSLGKTAFYATFNNIRILSKSRVW